MAILKWTVVVLVLLVVLLGIVGLLLPRRVHVERTAVIEAPRATVFTILNGFKPFNKWSPWAELDPGAQYTFEGPESGVGSRMSWRGDPKTVGSGSQEIAESRPYEAVVVRLDFGDQGLAVARYTLSPEGAATRMTWGFDTDLGMNPVSRYFGLMFERMIGPDFEKGLASLKRLAESLPETDFAGLPAERVEVAPRMAAVVTGSSSADPQAIGAALGAAYGQISRFLAAKGLAQAGPPFAVNTKWDASGYAFEAGIPVEAAPAGTSEPDSPVVVRSTYSGPALKVTHRGPYSAMEPLYDKLNAYAAASGYEAAGPSWDEYVSDPGAAPEAELITNIYLPVK